MANFNSSFDNGEGSLTIEYDGTPGTSSSTPSADCNCGEDRNTTVRVDTIDGTLHEDVLITQEGVRERFIPADDEEGLMGSDEEYFLSIKDSVLTLPEEC